MGTSVAASKAPTPMPQNISGPSVARRDGSAAAIATDGPSTMSAAPAMPEISRQTKNTAMGWGRLQPAKLSATATQQITSTRSAPMRSASGAATRAPIR